jgi:DNA-directed RNA polymerase beta' subunit
MTQRLIHRKRKEMMSEQVQHTEQRVMGVVHEELERAKHTREACNVLTDMVVSGSKGKASDLAALRVSAGLQLLDGEFLHTSADGRLSSHTKTTDDGVPGWCDSSLSQGMNAQELVCHSINARKKLCDSSAQVHTTGAMNRAGAHMLLGYERKLGGAVANRSNNILLFDDGSNYSGRGIANIQLPFNQFLLQKRPWATVASSTCRSTLN